MRVRCPSCLSNQQCHCTADFVTVINWQRDKINDMTWQWFNDLLTVRVIISWHHTRWWCTLLNTVSLWYDTSVWYWPTTQTTSCRRAAATICPAQACKWWHDTSYTHMDRSLTLCPCWPVSTARSKQSGLVTLTFWPWKWRPSHVGYLCQF